MKGNTVSQKKLNLLSDLGISEGEARILLIFDKYNGGLKQKDICFYGYMYQPTASMALKRLVAKRWVKIVNRIPSEGRGRPYAIYALKKTFNEILTEIQGRIDGDYELACKGVERLKGIA